MYYFVKYGKREHVKAFFEDGSIQIGTVRAYDQETHGDQIGDDYEGISRQAVTDDTISAHLAAGYPMPNGFGPGCFGNLALVTNVCHNYAIYSTSVCLHADLCRNFDPSYDAAILIMEPFAFFHEVTNAFRDSGLVDTRTELRLVRRVEYRGRDIHPDEYVREEFLKDVQYAHQGEVRATWMVGEPDRKFYRFKAPRAIWPCLALPIEAMPTYAPDDPQEVKDKHHDEALSVARNFDPLRSW